MQVERLKLLRKYIKWRKGEEYISMYPKVKDSPGKLGVILDVVSGSKIYRFGSREYPIRLLVR